MNLSVYMQYMYTCTLYVAMYMMVCIYTCAFIYLYIIPLACNICVCDMFLRDIILSYSTVAFISPSLAADSFSVAVSFRSVSLVLKLDVD